eukprot:9126380-Pyramimonas_sp.AAC.1
MSAAYELPKVRRRRTLLLLPGPLTTPAPASNSPPTRSSLVRRLEVPASFSKHVRFSQRGPVQGRHFGFNNLALGAGSRVVSMFDNGKACLSVAHAWILMALAAFRAPAPLLFAVEHLYSNVRCFATHGR